MTISTVAGAVRSILQADSGVSSLIGSRVYAVSLPDSCLFPAISIHKISDPYSRIKGSPRVQVSAWAEDPLLADQISAAVETALNGYSGTQGNIKILQITPLESNDFPADDAGLYQVSYDFLVLYKK